MEEPDDVGEGGNAEDTDDAGETGNTGGADGGGRVFGALEVEADWRDGRGYE